MELGLKVESDNYILNKLLSTPQTKVQKISFIMKVH